MENFAYRGREANTGKVVSGVLKARDRGAAIAFLQNRAITVIRLEPANLAFVPEEPSTQTPPSNYTPLYVAAFLFLAGSAYMLGTSKASSQPALESHKPVVIRYHLQVTGQIQLPPSIEPGVVFARVTLPEISLSVGMAGSQLFSGQNGQFVIDYHFASEKKPSSFNFSASSSHSNGIEIKSQALAEKAQGEEVLLAGNVIGAALQLSPPTNKKRLRNPFPAAQGPDPKVSPKSALKTAPEFRRAP